MAFDQIDIDSDKRISYKEFEFAVPILKRWGIEMSNPQALWNECDANGGGAVLFDEFCDWAIKQSLKLPENDEKISNSKSARGESRSRDPSVKEKARL